MTLAPDLRLVALATFLEQRKRLMAALVEVNTYRKAGYTEDQLAELRKAQTVGNVVRFLTDIGIPHKLVQPLLSIMDDIGKSAERQAAKAAGKSDPRKPVIESMRLAFFTIAVDALARNGGVARAIDDVSAATGGRLSSDQLENLRKNMTAGGKKNRRYRNEAKQFRDRAKEYLHLLDELSEADRRTAILNQVKMQAVALPKV